MASGTTFPETLPAEETDTRTERQPPYAAFRRAAEFRGFVNRVPQAGGIDLQIGGDFGHSAFRKTCWCVSSVGMVELCSTTCRGMERFR